MKKIIITIDGPASSGKGRIAKYIAKKYNLLHIDSGLLYRKVAKLLIDHKINLNNTNQIKKILINTKKLTLRNNNNFFQLKFPPALLNCSLKVGKLVLIESASLI